jgi:Family of unknown function (DUF6459)
MTGPALRSPVTPLDSGRRLWRSADSLPFGHVYTQGALALTYPLGRGLEAEPRTRALTAVRGPRQPARPGADAWAARFLQAVVEVVVGDRPLTQLVRWTDEQVYAEIAARQQHVAAQQKQAAVRRSRMQVATVHVCHPTHESAEIAARVVWARRSRALAARLELRRDRWLCTAIVFG